MAGIQANSIFKTPLPWRRDTPLHAQMGALSLRYKWTAAQTLPLAASPLSIRMQYTADTMDRIIGFTLVCETGATAVTFAMVENNTGWMYSAIKAANAPLLAHDNIETLPDMADLTVTFSVDSANAVYLAFHNFEVVPFCK
jgi:hypothetical protein